jgi:hypothetical protein
VSHDDFDNQDKTYFAHGLGLFDATESSDV